MAHVKIALRRYVCRRGFGVKEDCLHGSDCSGCYSEGIDTSYERYMSYDPCYYLTHVKAVVEKTIKNYLWTGADFYDGYVDGGYFSGGGICIDARDIYRLEIDGEILQDFDDDDLGDWGPETRDEED